MAGSGGTGRTESKEIQRLWSRSSWLGILWLIRCLCYVMKRLGGKLLGEEEAEMCCVVHGLKGWWRDWLMQGFCYFLFSFVLVVLADKIGVGGGRWARVLPTGTWDGKVLL
jgi:hypothetical protein